MNRRAAGESETHRTAGGGAARVRSRNSFTNSTRRRAA